MSAVVLTILSVWSCLAALGWVLFYGRVRRGARRVRAFEDIVVDAAPKAWPTVSLIVPACDEADTLPAALTSLRGLDYPSLEVVVVDDRSTDGTPSVVAAAAAADPRVRAVRVDALPDGWLGKVHAQARGVDAATGSWLLFTDADVVFAPDALKRAIAHAERTSLDHIVVVARGRPPTFALDVVECALASLIHGAAAVSRRRQRVVGSGQFSLARRAVFDRSEGLAWLKMEPADDFGLSLLLQRAGARQDFFVARSDVAFQWYPTWSSMVRGFEKNLFPVATGYRAAPAVGFAFAIASFAIGPFVAPLAFGPKGVVVAAAALLALGAATVVRARLSGRRFFALLLAPLGQLVLAAVLLRAMVVVLGSGGITWRGTTYPLAALRAGQRVRQRRA